MLLAVRLRSLALALLFVCSACGYHFGPVDGESTTISVEMFGNKTTEPQLEMEFTNLMISELARSPLFTPVEDVLEGQLSLEGTVTGYTSSAVAYNSDDKIVRYLVTVKAAVTLREEPSGRVLWKGKADGAKEYPVDADKGLQRLYEEQARNTALIRLAEEISRRLGQRF
ncbi:MAG: hypothetical protein C0624_06295 [Desulfuromonas sp.]|nr:MAG: hypothetical protein C0624_06295 [Desulfuromonas sp.]